MGKLTIAQLRKANKKLELQHAKEKELKELKQKNYALRNRKSIAFFKKIAKGGASVGKYTYKKTLAPLTPEQKKRLKKRKQLNINELF